MPDSAVSRENRILLCQLAETAPAGEFVEVGVWLGGSAVDLYQVSEAQGRILHLFDSFAGMPIQRVGLDHFPIGSFPVPLDTPQQLLALMPNVKIHKGIYPATHPADLNGVAFVHVDCDQYESYRGVIDRMWPIVVPGGMMLFDDYPYLRGAKQAVEETFSPAELRSCGEHFYVIKPGLTPEA